MFEDENLKGDASDTKSIYVFFGACILGIIACIVLLILKRDGHF